MVKVKICGITNLKDAQASIDAGCDALGFMFYRKSPRFIEPEKAKKIIKRLPVNIVKIGVFVNAREKTVKQIAGRCHLDMLQFHGDESVEFCRKFRRYKVIKVFRVKSRLVPQDILKYKVFAYLFDTLVPGKPGGTGKTFDWKMIKHLSGIKQPVFLSGGLNANNVKKAIKIMHPVWVDACSGVELKPGKKDVQKIRGFIKAAKSSR